MLKVRFFAAAATLFLGAGCVPLTDYQRLEARYKEQETYVQRNKDHVKELERREQFLTLQAAEREKDKQLIANRLALSERLRKQLEDELRKKGTSVAAGASEKPVTVTGDFKINHETGGIVLENDVLFASGQSVLKESGRHLLEKLCAKLNSAEFSRYEIRIDGHTDDQPVTHTKKENHDNWELSFKRAKVVFEFMKSKGISEKRCFLAEFADLKPINHDVVKSEAHHSKKGGKETAHETSDARSQNRRVEIVLFEKK